jgi:hypothetical protein
MEVFMIRQYFRKWYETVIFVAGNAISLASVFLLMQGFIWLTYYALGDSYFRRESYVWIFTWLELLWVKCFQLFLYSAIAYQILNFFFGDEGIFSIEKKDTELSPSTTSTSLTESA